MTRADVPSSRSMPPKKPKDPVPPSAPLIPEGVEPLQAVVSMVDKKVRNLEKRKIRLETLKENVMDGKRLDKDQMAAVEKLNLVDNELDMLKELQKNIVSIQAESQKLKKKLQKAEIQQQKDQAREFAKRSVIHALKTNYILNLIDDPVKEDLKGGLNGAPKLEEEDLTALDEFYQLVNPDGSADNYDDNLSEASEHLMLLSEQSTKSVASTTYQHLFEVLESIETSGYLATLSSREDKDDPPVIEGGVTEEQGEADVADYDVIGEGDLPSSEQVQVVVQQHESQEVLRQKSEGVTQEQSLGLSSQGQLIDQESSMVDFPGLDTATIENIGGYSFMHDSEVTEDASNRGITQAPTDGESPVVISNEPDFHGNQERLQSYDFKSRGLPESSESQSGNSGWKQSRGGGGQGRQGFGGERRNNSGPRGGGKFGNQGKRGYGSSNYNGSSGRGGGGEGWERPRGGGGASQPQNRGKNSAWSNRR